MTRRASSADLRRRALRAFIVATGASSAVALAAAGCGDDDARATEGDAGPSGPVDGGRVCSAAGERHCELDVLVTCELEQGFLVPRRTSCAASNQVCTPSGCQPCVPEQTGCFEGNAARCKADGSGWDVTASCDLEAGEGCREGACVDLCERAVDERSYEGCSFYPVDLDTSGLPADRVAGPPFGVIVSNPNPFPTRVVLEKTDTAYGTAATPTTIAELVVPGFDLEVFELPRRRIDGVELDGDAFRETHASLTSRAYHVRATHPIIAYQFNPLAAHDTFSNDASLLFPTSALGTVTTVVGWPQLLTNRGTALERSGYDYRATLTIVGTEADTRVTVTLGADAKRVLGPAEGETHAAGDVIEVELGPFDVLNLETDAFAADFTGSVVESSAPVAVYSGHEGADAPVYAAYRDRLCCADHVEGQLLPDRSLGRSFVLGRTPARAPAINLAISDPFLALPEADEPEYARILAVAEGTTTVTTTLPYPNEYFELERGQSVILTLDRDAIVEADRPVSVIQMLATQQATGIPDAYPGGDPALIVVPPVDQFRDGYVFLTPDTYGFDAVTIVAPPDATVLLDRAPLPVTCETAPADGLPRGPEDPPPAYVVHRCPLSFPEVAGDLSVHAGTQNDGVHRVQASAPVGVVVSGFDLFVSYAYAAGMNLEPIE